MTAQTNFLVYDHQQADGSALMEKLAKHQTSLPFEPGNFITTLDPRNIVFIRCCTVIALTAIGALVLQLATFSAIWYWPAAAICSTYLVWTTYSQLLCKDPLVEAFYKIVGGKKEYEKLPKLALPKAKIDRIAGFINWDALSNPIYRAETPDGRKVMIFKALSTNKHTAHHATKSFSTYPKAIFIFIEKLSGGYQGSGSNSKDNSIRETFTKSYIWSDLANAFAIQWQNRQKTIASV